MEDEAGILDEPLLNYAQASPRGPVKTGGVRLLPLSYASIIRAITIVPLPTIIISTAVAIEIILLLCYLFGMPITAWRKIASYSFFTGLGSAVYRVWSRVTLTNWLTTVLDTLPELDPSSTQPGDDVKITGVVVPGDVDLVASWSVIPGCVYVSTVLESLGNHFFSPRDWEPLGGERLVVDFHVHNKETGVSALVKVVSDWPEDTWWSFLGLVRAPSRVIPLVPQDEVLVRVNDDMEDVRLFEEWQEERAAWNGAIETDTIGRPHCPSCPTRLTESCIRGGEVVEVGGRAVRTLDDTWEIVSSPSLKGIIFKLAGLLPPDFVRLSQNPRERQTDEEEEAPP